jgi:hypothetical protein
MYFFFSEVSFERDATIRLPILNCKILALEKHTHFALGWSGHLLLGVLWSCCVQIPLRMQDKLKNTHKYSNGKASTLLTLNALFFFFFFWH